MRKAEKITVKPPSLTVDEFIEVVKNSKEPVIAENQYGNDKFYKTIMTYEIINGELRCKNWEGEILEPPYLKTGQLFRLCDVIWKNAKKLEE